LVVLPCDVPQVEADDLRRLIHALTSDSQVAVACSSHPDGSVDHHWLVSAWRTEVADVVQLAYERGVRSIHEVVRLLDVQLVLCEATSLRNFNEQTS
jgi:molybdopterin-guanine dinucleotide biosynthesis protein A